MPFVKELEQEFASDPKFNHEYLWFLGMDTFNKRAPEVILGKGSSALLEGRVSGCERLDW
jgi:aspartate/tyrosine/aromatic aminotransferase